MMKNTHKIYFCIIIILFLVTILILTSSYMIRGIPNEVLEVPQQYFVLLNEGCLTEAYNMLHIEPTQKSPIEALFKDYKTWPPQFRNIVINRPVQINHSLYRVDISIFNDLINKNEEFQSFILNDHGSWKFILNQYNIPEQYLENVIFVEDENYIHPNEIIG